MIDHLSSKVCAAAEFAYTPNQAGTVAIATIPKRRRMSGLTNKWNTNEQCKLMMLCSCTCRNSYGVKGE
jgi:hypothetical protein